MDSFTSYCLNRLHMKEVDLDLIVAARSGLLEETKRLVSIGADAAAANHAAFICAAGKGHLEVVKYLASVGVDITVHDNNALRRAASNGQVDVVEYLVSVGADVTADDNYATRYAAEGGYVETVKYLIPLGADIEVVYEILGIDSADIGKDELLANLDTALMASSPSEASEALRRAVEECRNMVHGESETEYEYSDWKCPSDWRRRRPPSRPPSVAKDTSITKTTRSKTTKN